METQEETCSKKRSKNTGREESLDSYGTKEEYVIESNSSDDDCVVSNIPWYHIFGKYVEAVRQGVQEKFLVPLTTIHDKSTHYRIELRSPFLRRETTRTVSLYRSDKLLVQLYDKISKETRAGIVVGNEDMKEIVENAIDQLNKNPRIPGRMDVHTRQELAKIAA